MAKVSTKIVLKEKKDNGSVPVEIWINHKSKRRKKRLFWVPVSDWDKKKGLVMKSNPGHVKMNNWIRLEMKKYQDRIFDLEMKGEEFSIDEIMSDQVAEIPTLHSLVIQMRDEKMRLNQKENPYTFQKLADKLQEFQPGATCENVDKAFVDRFKAFLLTDERINSPNTVARYLKRLKQVLRGQFEQGNYNDMRVLSYPTSGVVTKKSVLTVDELRRWESVELPGSLHLCRDFFMMMFYLRGARVGDVLQLTPGHINDGRIIYREQKTKKIQDQLIIPQVRRLIDRYESQSPHYLFPVMKRRPDDPDRNPSFQKHIESCTAKLNLRYRVIAEMAGINKKVTNHVARHTFASIAKDSGLSTGVIQEILNHSAESTTEKYIQSLKINEQLDQAAQKVFG